MEVSEKGLSLRQGVMKVRLSLPREPVYTGEPVKTYREYLARPKKEKEERQREREGRRQKMLERMRELRARERKGNGKVRTKAKAKRGLEKVAGSAS